MSFQVTGLPEADVVLDEHPFAVVVAVLLDQQQTLQKVRDFKKAKKAAARAAS
ncbi:hypothetical protein GCM10027059_45200 [Myceligenerans halotolerans]